MIWISMPSDRHNQGGNLAFADGHCEYWRWLYPKVFRFPGQQIANEADLQDMERIRNDFPAPR
jgi:prepilin-type processing-associated H-X9-DG protein